MWFLFLFFFLFFKINRTVKHFLFQTRFWFILEVLLNICKITSSQTSTLQRPFQGPLSLGHCKKRLTYSPRQGEAPGLIQVPCTLLQTICGDVLCGKNLLHIQPPTNAALPRWLWRTAVIRGTNITDRSGTEAGRYSLQYCGHCRELCAEFWAIGVTNCTGWPCFSNKTIDVEAPSIHWQKITPTHQLQTLAREVLSFWSLENSHQQPN